MLSTTQWCGFLRRVRLCLVTVSAAVMVLFTRLRLALIFSIFGVVVADTMAH